MSIKLEDIKPGVELIDTEGRVTSVLRLMQDFDHYALVNFQHNVLMSDSMFIDDFIDYLNSSGYGIV